MFSREQIKTLLEAQNTLNNHYVPNWKNNVPKEKFLTAFQCEWAEFLESAPRFFDHKWWKPTMEDDIQNAKVEIVDMLHFGLSLIILQQEGVEFEGNKIDTQKFNVFYSYLMDMNYLEEMSESQEEKFNLNSILTTLKGFSDYAIEKNKVHLIALFLIEFLEQLCIYVRWNSDDLYNAYWKKNELNLKRIQEGYMEGKYKKIDEHGREDNRSLDI